jgi:hypothetical protein
MSSSVPCPRKTGISGGNAPGEFSQQRMPGFDLGRMLGVQEILLQRLLGELAPPEVEWPLDAFLDQLIDCGHRSRVDYLIHLRIEHPLPGPQRHRGDILAADGIDVFVHQIPEKKAAIWIWNSALAIIEHRGPNWLHAAQPISPPFDHVPAPAPAGRQRGFYETIWARDETVLVGPFVVKKLLTPVC